MSIIIKDMEVPTSCAECPCCRHDNWNGETAHQCNVSFITFGAEDENWIYNTRPNWCPLIELPPHGRLVDADKLMMSLADWWYSSFGEEETDEAKAIRKVWDTVEQSIGEMTVVEAEGNEE